MSGLIVIRIVPKSPIAPDDFTQYFNPLRRGPALHHGLRSVVQQPDGWAVDRQAKFIWPFHPKPDGPNPRTRCSLHPPNSATARGSPSRKTPARSVLAAPSVHPESPYFTLESVATAVIAVTDTLTFENLRLVAQWGTGASAVSVAITLDYYDVALAPAASPTSITGRP